MYSTHSSVGSLVFHPSFSYGFPNFDIVKTRLLNIARDKTIGPTADPSELLGPPGSSLL